MLILTEKPSVAKSFAAALSVQWHKDGYYKSGDTVITNCVGHLFELYSPSDYDDKYKRYSFDSLPIIPDKFQYLAKSDTLKQTKLVLGLLAERSHDKIIIATDADREGEIIARIVLEQARISDTSNCWRFWVSEALTPDVIRAGMKSLKPWSDYDFLAEQGFARQHADWLVGMNLTRYATLSAGNRESFPVGRVQTAILAAVAQRNNEVRNFVSEPYFECAAHLSDRSGNVFDALLVNPDTNKTTFGSDGGYISDAVEFSKKDLGITVKAETKRKKTNPPQLLSLTQLQKIAASDFGYTASRTLNIVQKLYEDYKCMSYPRTPSSVMGDDDVDLFRSVFKELSPLFEISKFCDESLISSGYSHVFNSKKLDSHHALIPLSELPSNVSEEEKNIYDTVARYFFLSVMPPFIYDDKIIQVRNGDFLYKGSVKTPVSLGWKNVRQQKETDEDKDIKQFDENSAVLGSCEILRKMTKPKKEFTESSLLAFMENPVGSSTDGKLVGLGTPATRASILKKLEQDKYIERKGKNFIATDKGVFLLNLLFKNSLTARIASISQTTQWEHMLSESPKNFESSIIGYVKESVAVRSDVEGYGVTDFGKCPRCGKPVIEGKVNYYCSGYKDNPSCDFVIWKTISGCKVSVSDVRQLLSGETTGLKKMKTKAGKDFTAKLCLKDNKVEFLFDYNKKSKSSK